MSRNYLQLGDPDPPHARLSEEFGRLAKYCEGKNITFGDLMGTIEHRSHALLVLVLATPFLLPLPLPGLSTPIGIILVIVGVKKSFGHLPWLPKWLWRKKIPSKTFVDILRVGQKAFKRVEKIIRPRGRIFQNNHAFRIVNGMIIASCGVLLSLPLPPGTNFPPALCVILVAIGVLERDMIFSILGYIAFVLNLVLFSMILFFGVEGIQWLSKYIEFIKQN